MQPTEYYEKIIQYYKDSWDMNNSLAIHYGYWDKAVDHFQNL